MKRNNVILIFLILLVAQIFIWSYLNFTQILTLSLLPAMILCLPNERGPVFSMAIAFVSGIAVDFLAGGLLGLTSFALVPVALSRRAVIRLVYGQELFARGEEISISRYGPMKFIICSMIANALFFILFVWTDGAGMRPLTFNVAKIILSTAASVLLSLVVAGLMCDDSGSKWT